MVGSNSGEKKKTIYNHFPSAAVKMAQYSHTVCVLSTYVYQLGSNTVIFPLGLNHVSWELFTADMVTARRCSNNYINNFHFRIHTCIITFAYIGLEAHAKAHV